MTENFMKGLPSGNSTESQRKRILEFLRRFGSLTTLQARHKLDIMHPGMRVCELRKVGYEIQTVWVEDISYPQNRIHRVAKYVLSQPHPIQLSLFQTSKGAA